MSVLEDNPSRDELIEENLGYATALALQLRATLSVQVDTEELVAMGRAGLVEAAERFDPTRGVAFTTFAYYRIRGAIFDGLKKRKKLRSAEASFARGANDYLENRFERVPPEAVPRTAEGGLADLAGALDDLATIYVTAAEGCGELDAVWHAGDGSELVVAREERAALRRAIEDLPERERRIIELYYFEERTLEESGRALGLSKSWASRLHSRAVRLLGESMAALGHGR